MKTSLALFLLAAVAGTAGAATTIDNVRHVYTPGTSTGQVRQFQDASIGKFEQHRRAPASDSYYVTWTPDPSLAAKPELVLQYRQERKPNVGALVIKYPWKVQNQREATFTIREQALKQFGPVTAWRVLVRSNGRVVAEAKSPSWR